MKRRDRKSAKTESDQGHTEPHKNSTGKQDSHVSGSINVRGEIETKRPADLTQEHNAERKDDKASATKKFIVEVATLVVIAIYAALTLWQARSANTSAGEAVKANAISRDGLVTVQRAFIVFKHFEQVRAIVSPAPSVKIQWQFDPLIENTGATPAIIATEDFSLEHLENGEPTEEQFVGDNERPTFSIGPHSEQIGPTRDIDDVYIIGSVNGIPGPNASNAVGRNVFGWGFIVYKDVFADTKIRSPIHVTEYCSQLQRVIYGSTSGKPLDRTKPLDKATTFKLVWHACDEHNCVDQYCKDYDKIAKLLPN